ncbi:ABC transporter permease [Pseudothermotoga sp.]|nr:ABC transporter permease [Pseudothermotoga sp.]MCX7813554.1 ABC transporter permease [Pseudothermotoga sp.]MDW8140042.1 ABC transporter permease [Pseudothermotoga sp.]
MSRKFFAFAKAYTVESVRNFSSLFMTLFFPVVFLVIFGFLFGGESDYRRTMGVCVDNPKVLSALQNDGNWNLKIYEKDQELIRDVEKGKIPMGLSVQSSKVVLHYQDNPSLMGEVKMIELSVRNTVEKALNSTKQFVKIETVQLHQTEKEISGFDYMVMGVIALSLFSNGMFSMITVFGNYRKKGVLKMVSLTTTKPITVVSSVSLIRLIFSFVSLFVVLLVCKIIFKSDITFNWLLLIPTVVFVTLGMMAIGVLIVSIFKNPNAAINVASVLNTVMVFFSGVYFPISFMPDYLRWIAYILPVKYAADLVRFSANAHILSVSYFLTVNTIFLFGGIFALWVSAKFFMRPE